MKADALACALIFTIGCGSQDKQTFCVPGQEAACNCIDGSEGSQRCKQDGSGYDECVCQKPLGELCAQPDECYTNFCADGVCCDAACDGVCLKCDMPGAKGHCAVIPATTDPDDECGRCAICTGTVLNAGCSKVPAGQDPLGECSPGRACDGRGECRLLDGETCQSDAECIGGSCMEGKCGQAGTEAWRFEASDEIAGAPSLATDGTIYFGDGSGVLYALSAAGAEKWRFPAGGAIRGSPAISREGVIYFGSDDKNLYAVGADGTVYIGTSRGVLFAIRGSGGPCQACPWPGYQHDPRHSGNAAE